MHHYYYTFGISFITNMLVVLVLVQYSEHSRIEHSTQFFFNVIAVMYNTNIMLPLYHHKYHLCDGSILRHYTYTCCNTPISLYFQLSQYISFIVIPNRNNAFIMHDNNITHTCVCEYDI